MRWYDLDWTELFTPTVPALELMVRGTLMYVGIFVVPRMLLRRVAGNVTIADLLMVVLWRNLRREFISEAELRSQMREQGVQNYTDVKVAHMEGDGRISVVKRE